VQDIHRTDMAHSILLPVLKRNHTFFWLANFTSLIRRVSVTVEACHTDPGGT